MSNALTEARNDVAAVLSGLGISGLRVYPYHPDSLSTPAAVVIPSDTGTYLKPGQTFGDWDVSLKVRIFLGTGTNEVLTKTLDGLIVEASAALRKEFGGAIVSSPIDDVTTGTLYLTVDITIPTLTYKGGN